MITSNYIDLKKKWTDYCEWFWCTVSNNGGRGRRSKICIWFWEV